MDAVKVNKVKEFVNTLQIEGKPCRVGGDFMESLNSKVEKIVLDGKLRAEQNGRVTISGKDL